MPTSRSAALDVRVLAVLRARGLLTAAQIGEALDLDRLPVRRALVRLQERGLVRLAGVDHDEASARAGVGAPGIWEAVPAAHP